MTMSGIEPQRSVRSKVAAALAAWLPLLTVVVGLSLAAGAYFGLYRSKLGEMIGGGRLDLGPLRSAASVVQGQLTLASETVAAYSRLNSEYRLRIAAAMPTQSDAPGIILQLDAIARANNMALATIDVSSDEKPTSDLRLVRVTADVRGADYGQFKLFLADIERSLRPFDLQTVSFAAPGGVYGLTMNAYWLDTQYSDKSQRSAATAPAVLPADVVGTE